MSEAPVPIPTRLGTHRMPCPYCEKGRHDDALGVTVHADGHAVWHCFRCGAAGGTGNGAAQRGPEPAARAEPQPAAGDNKAERARRLVRRCGPAQGTLAERYLATRKVELPAAAPLFYTDSAFHWPSGGNLPCMVAPIVPVDAHDADLPQAAHQTFLAADGTGKAQVDKARLYLGPKAGGVVKLTPDAEITTALALAEGLETGLSAIMAGLPTWACLDSGNLAAFPVLPGLEGLTVIADYDKAGIAAAENVGRRWHDAGAEVRLLLPHDIGADLNDTAREVSHA